MRHEMTPLILIHQLPPRVVIYTRETPDARFKKPLFMRHEMTLLILIPHCQHTLVMYTRESSGRAFLNLTLHMI